jgi:Asp-tRNA(Asn)/Glu-tRNA(Gln) amidotransferase A subunit family amidase
MNETAVFRSATDAAQAIRRKELSSRELTEMLLARIASTLR